MIDKKLRWNNDESDTYPFRFCNQKSDDTKIADKDGWSAMIEYQWDVEVQFLAIARSRAQFCDAGYRLLEKLYLSIHVCTSFPKKNIPNRDSFIEFRPCILRYFFVETVWISRV